MVRAAVLCPAGQPRAAVPTWFLLRADGSLLTAQRNKSSEVVWGPFVSASSSRLTLARPAFGASLAGTSARSSLGLRAHRQPDKPTLRLGTLSCLQHFFFVRLDQRFAIDPCSPSVSPRGNTVTALGPRTPHQPEKLKKLSKNNPVLLLPEKTSIEKPRSVSGFIFNRVQPVHKRVTEFGAMAASVSCESRAKCRFSVIRGSRMK
jgi:hypothetical protein